MKLEYFYKLFGLRNGLTMKNLKNIFYQIMITLEQSVKYVKFSVFLSLKFTVKNR